MSFFSFPAQVNEYAARCVATGVIATLAVAAIFDQPWLFAVLAVGFLLRVGWGPRFSPLARLAMAIAARVWTPKPVTGAPKRFAQGIGATCMISSTALFFTGHAVAAWSLAGLVAVFAFLEASIAFCMGCTIYAQLQRWGVFPPDACVDCAPNAALSMPRAR